MDTLHNLPPLPTAESLARRFAAENEALVASHKAIAASFAEMPLKIETEEQAGKCADLAKQMRSGWREAENKRVLEKKPFDELAAVAHTWFGRIAQDFERMGRSVLARADVFQAAKREAERKRLAEEAARQRAEAERLAAENKIEAAVQVAEAAQKTEAQAAAPSVARTTGALGGQLGSRTVWEFTIDDITKLPKEYLLPNMAAIRAWMHGQVKAKIAPEMPGVTFKQVTSTTGR